MKNQFIKKTIPLLSILLLAVCLICAGCQKKGTPADSVTGTEPQTQTQAIDNTIEWKGKTYTYNKNLTNIMFLGIDQKDPINTEVEPGTAGQSDCIMILSLDQSKNEGRILQINRNAMTRIDIYDSTGNRLEDMEGQICLQYAYCNGGNNSCWAVKKTLSELLFGLPIDGYFAMNLEATAEINDALGGIDVLMKQDYTDIDPSFAEGETIHLEGEAAERFIRHRDIKEFNSVQNRMERQVDYITSLIEKMHHSGGKKLYDVLSPYLDKEVLTDMDADQMNALTKYTYLTDEIAYLPGEMQMGEEYEEYYIDTDALQDLLVQTFYTEVK